MFKEREYLFLDASYQNRGGHGSVWSDLNRLLAKSLRRTTSPPNSNRGRRWGEGFPAVCRKTTKEERAFELSEG